MMNRTDTKIKRRVQKRSADRRKALIIRKMTFACMTGIFVLVFALSVFSLSAKANSTADASEYKYYTSHLIEPGESLWSIAESNMDTVHYDSVQDYMDEIRSINGISGDKIQSGYYLLIPYFSEEAKGCAAN